MTGGPVYGLDIGVEDGVPLFGRVFMNGLDDADSGIAHEDIEAAKSFHGRFDAFDRGRFLADIAGNELQSIAVPAFQLLELCRKIRSAIYADNAGCIALKIPAGYGETDA